MKKRKVPRFYGLRIYLSSTILYNFLVVPFLFFVVIQNIPQLLEGRNFSNKLIPSQVDSLGYERDSNQVNEDRIQQESRKKTVYNLEINNDSITSDSISPGEVQESGLALTDNGSMSYENKAVGKFFKLLFRLLLVSFIIGFGFNLPFKRYFRRKREKKKISGRLHTFCKKCLLYTPLINSGILFMPYAVLLVYSIFLLLSENKFQGEVERNVFLHFFYVSIVASLLAVLFVYFWQKHRVHIKYIEFLYSEQELRKRIFKFRGGKIRSRFLIASGMTTFLPLTIVLVYLILSLTSVKELHLDSITPAQKEILFGVWGSFSDQANEAEPIAKYEKLYYVNAIDTLVMLIGIGTGIFASFIYILLFVKWTNQDIVGPVKELLYNMRKIRGTEMENYSIVRTNDEIGELAEGFNEMTKKIRDYINSISGMNIELEKKVKERTKEIMQKKEEIETQKEEIESQLDITTYQRDTMAKQKQQILDSIHYAERIQSAILPPEEFLSEYFPEYFILFKPRDIVSGDFYWATRKDNKLVIAVADCTGHGVPGAFLSMLGMSFLNEIVNKSESIHANQILGQLRDYVIKSLHQTGKEGEAQDGIEIALCVIDIKKKKLQYSGANTPIYLIRKNNTNPVLSPEGGGVSGRGGKEGANGYKLMHIKADKMPIGIYENEVKPFTNYEIQLVKDDSIYLFSDGYVDQLGGLKRKTLRAKYFKQLLINIQDKPMQKQKKILEKKLETWKGDVEQIDDILIMGVRIL